MIICMFKFNSVTKHYTIPILIVLSLIRFLKKVSFLFLKIKQSIYDLVLLDVCHFHNHVTVIQL